MYLSNSTKKSTNSETAMLSMWGATKQDVGEIQFGLRSLLCELLWWLKSDGLFGWTIWSLTWMPPFSRWSNVVVVFRCKFFSSDVELFLFLLVYCNIKTHLLWWGNEVRWRRNNWNVCCCCCAAMGKNIVSCLAASEWQIICSWSKLWKTEKLPLGGKSHISMDIFLRGGGSSTPSHNF